MEHKKSSRQILAEILTANAAAAATAGGVVDAELAAIKRKLDNGTLKFQDASVYSAKDISGRTQIRMFETSDVETKGISNITAAKLGIDQLLLVNRVRLMAATSPNAINGSPTVLGALPFGSIIGKGDLTNGTFSVRQQNKNESLEISLRSFESTEEATKVQGVYYLDSPLLLRPQQLLEFNLELGKAAPDRTALRLELLGTQTAAF